MRAAASLVLLLAAVALGVSTWMPASLRPARPIRPETEEIARLLAQHPQRSELARFYRAVADVLPRLRPAPTGREFRDILERAVRLRFEDEFTRVPGLAAAIHGDHGAIAKLYGLDAGPLDIQKMQAALRAVADASDG